MVLLIIKCLFLVIMFLFIYVKRVHIYNKITWLFLVMALLISSYLASDFAERIPGLTDEVTLTALGQKSEEAIREEVFLSHFLVDGKEVKVTSPVTGKWFWSGEMYAWRIESDPRQPGGCTREVVLKVPVGRDRKAVFSSNEWRGFVQISFDGNTQTVDTYSLDWGTVLADIGESNLIRIILNGMRKLVFYITVMLLLSGGAVFLAEKMLLKASGREQWWKEKGEILVLMLISAACFLYMHSLVGIEEFWEDELYTLGFIQEDVCTAITVDGANMPLYYVLIYFWYRLMPYGEKYLLLLNEVAAVIGCFVIGMTCRRFYGFKESVIAILYAGVSPVVVSQCGHELRCYSFLLLFSAMALYIYLARISEVAGNNWKNQIMFCIVMVLLAYTHYFGLFLCVVFFIYESLLLCIKKNSIKFIVPYILAAVSYVPWLLFITKALAGSGGLTWQEVPDFEGLVTLFKYLCGNSGFVYYAAAMGIATTAACIFIGIGKGRGFDRVKTAPMFIVLFFIGFMYYYATHIGYLSTFWAGRYFICLFPCVIALFACGINAMEKWLVSGKEQTLRISIYVCIFMVSFLPFCDGVKYAKVSSQKYRSAAEYIYEQSNSIFNDDTLIITTRNIYLANGWNEYYISRRGKRDALHVVSQYEIGSDLGYARLYVECDRGINSNLQRILSENYILESDNTDVKVKCFIRK